MKKNLLIMLLLFALPIFVKGEDHSIVFIHIGKEVPSYVDTALSQARVFNKECPVILLANEEALNGFTTLAPDITYIACESLKKTPSHNRFIKESRLDRESREGFWLYASERFLYLYDLMEHYGLHHVFHLEYDNMLYADLGELLPIFETAYQGIAATFDNDQRCIPGFVYISNKESMKELASCFAAHASEGLNDMQILALFKEKNEKEQIDNLPIITEEYVEAYPLVSPMGHTVKDERSYFKNVEQFLSIFDAAALGQYLGGIDPRNGPSAPGFINESCVLNPSYLQIEWIEDEKGRRCPYVIYPNRKYRINNLHIHSKKLEQFHSEKL